MTSKQGAGILKEVKPLRPAENGEVLPRAGQQRNPRPRKGWRAIRTRKIPCFVILQNAEVVKMPEVLPTTQISPLPARLPRDDIAGIAMPQPALKLRRVTSEDKNPELRA